MSSNTTFLQICVESRLTLEQVLFLYLIKLKDFSDSKSLSNQYIKKVQKFSISRVLSPLIDKDYVLDLNSNGKTFPEFMMLSPKGEKLFVTYEMGEDLWNTYPKTFPISGSGSFIARAGMEKDELINLYLSKIDYNQEQHLDIMIKLKEYSRLVLRGELNGHKIVTFVNEEIWDTIEVREKPKFGREI